MIALDFDGVVANYGDHTTEVRFNEDLFALLPGPQPVTICTNQGGMAFSFGNPDKYPSPERVAERLLLGYQFLAKHGYPVQQILVATFHPKASQRNIDDASDRLVAALKGHGLNFYVWSWESARKPSPFMLRACGATVFYGDSPEDGEAAVAAGIPFVMVERFV